MSGALVELVAKGVQDAYLTGDPEVSFFHQAYKRHTNFAQKPVPVQYTGTFGPNQQINMKLLNKGDLLGYIWIDLSNTSLQANHLNASTFELYIGGQLIDRQIGDYCLYFWQKFLVDSSAKGFALQGTNQTTNAPLTSINVSKWFPLHFFFCDSCYLPLVALQYHEVEIRISCGSDMPTPNKQPSIFANYIVLDTLERTSISNKEHNLLIEQVQSVLLNSERSSSSNKFDLSFLNHPVKCLLWGSSSGDTNTSYLLTNQVQLYLNGTEIFESPMSDIYFSSVQNYYHSEFASVLMGDSNSTRSQTSDGSGGNLKMYSFALKANKHQPCGTCNFSRLDTASLNFGSVIHGNVLHDNLYAVNFNIFRIKDGLGGLAFSS